MGAGEAIWLTHVADQTQHKQQMGSPSSTNKSSHTRTDVTVDPVREEMLEVFGHEAA